MLKKMLTHLILIRRSSPCVQRVRIRTCRCELSLWFREEALIETYKVQERALKVVPDLCDTIDYAEVQGVLFPRVAVRYLSQWSRSEALTILMDLSAGIHENKDLVSQSHDPANTSQHGQNIGSGMTFSKRVHCRLVRPF